MKKILQVHFCSSELLIQQQNEDTTSDQKVVLLKHLKFCNDCKRFLASEGLDEQDVILSILIEEDMANDDTFDSKKEEEEAEIIIRKVMKRIEREEREEKEKATVFSHVSNLFKSPPTFRSAFISIFIIVTCGIIFSRYGDIKSPLTKAILQKRSLVTVQFSVVREDSHGELTHSKAGRDKNTYSKQDNLLFRVLVDQPGYVYLVNTDINYNVNLAYAMNNNSLLDVGKYDLETEGFLGAYPLEHLEGRQYFFILYALDRIENIRENAVSYVKRIDTTMDIPKEISSYDFFEITVK